MKFLLLLMLTSCVKRNYTKEARAIMLKSDRDCLNTLRVNMAKAGCEQMRFGQTATSVTIRCEKPDNKRRGVWDSYYFRISSAKLRLNPGDAEKIQKQTICIDEYTRIEAWSP
jgi:hypothetical protein